MLEIAGLLAAITVFYVLPPGLVAWKVSQFFSVESAAGRVVIFVIAAMVNWRILVG